MPKKNISEDRKKYLRKIAINKTVIISTQIGIVLFCILLWEILANKNIIDSFIMSQPSRILDTFMNLSANGLLKHLSVTCIETLIGFSLGTVLRNNNCYNSMVVKISKQSSRTFFGSIK